MTKNDLLKEILVHKSMLKEVEDEYEYALSIGDSDLIEACSAELCFYEGAINTLRFLIKKYY